MTVDEFFHLSPLICISLLRIARSPRDESSLLLFSVFKCFSGKTSAFLISRLKSRLALKVLIRGSELQGPPTRQWDCSSILGVSLFGDPSSSTWTFLGVDSIVAARCRDLERREHTSPWFSCDPFDLTNTHPALYGHRA